MTGNTESFFFDETLNEVIQHRMDRENHVRLLRIEKVADEFVGVRVEKIALVRSTAIDEPEVVAHLLRTTGENRVVERAEGPIEFPGFLEGLSYRNFQTSGCARRFQCSSRAIVSLSRVR